MALCLKLNRLLELFTAASSSELAFKGLLKERNPGFNEECGRQHYDNDSMLGIRRTPANKGMRF